MRLKYFIVILALLLLMVSTASAYTIDTAEDGSTVNINVVYNPSTGTITYTDMNAAANTGITWIAYNVDSNAETIIGINADGTRQVFPDAPTGPNPSYDWDQQTNFGAGGEFGSFLRSYGGSSNPPKRYKTVTVILSDTGKPMQPNLLGNSVGVHYVFADGNSCFASEGGDSSIPEFPTMALPVAAILGLMFIFGRRKQE